MGWWLALRLVRPSRPLGPALPSPLPHPFPPRVPFPFPMRCPLLASGGLSPSCWVVSDVLLRKGCSQCRCWFDRSGLDCQGNFSFATSVSFFLDQRCRSFRCFCFRSPRSRPRGWSRQAAIFTCFGDPCWVEVGDPRCPFEFRPAYRSPLAASTVGHRAGTCVLKVCSSNISRVMAETVTSC